MAKASLFVSKARTGPRRHSRLKLFFALRGEARPPILMASGICTDPCRRSESFGRSVGRRILCATTQIRYLARMSHKGGGERRKAARSASGASSTSGNHRTGLLLRICSPSSPRMYRFFVSARQSTPQIGRRTQIRLATPFLSAAQSCDLQLPVHLAEQLQVRIARRQRHPDLAYGDANLGPDLEQL